MWHCSSPGHCKSWELAQRQLFYHDPQMASAVFTLTVNVYLGPVPPDMSYNLAGRMALPSHGTLKVAPGAREQLITQFSLQIMTQHSIAQSSAAALISTCRHQKSPA